MQGAIAEALRVALGLTFPPNKIVLGWDVHSRCCLATNAPASARS